MTTMQALCQWGKAVIDTEIAALQEITQFVDESFAKACQLILACKGKVIVMGMGKSSKAYQKAMCSMCFTIGEQDVENKSASLRCAHF